MSVLCLLGLVVAIVAALERWRRTEPEGYGLEALLLIAAGLLALFGIGASLLGVFGSLTAPSLCGLGVVVALLLWPWGIPAHGVALRRQSLLALAVTVTLCGGGLALRLPFMDYPLAGRDQGTYTLRAAETVRTGGFVTIDEALAEAAALAREGDRPGLSDVLGLYPRRHEAWREDVYESAYRPGWYLVDRDGGLVVPQFLHLHPALSAAAQIALGEPGLAVLVVLQALLTILAVWALARRLWPGEIWPLLAAPLFAVCPLAVWVHRNALSEVPTGMFMAVAAVALLRARRSPSSLDHAAFLLGAITWTRGNGWLMAPVLLAAAWLVPAGTPARRRSATIFIGLLLGSVMVHAATSFPYLFDEFHRQFGFLEPTPIALVLTTWLFGLGWISVDELWFGRRTSRFLIPRGPLLLACGLALAVAAYLWNSYTSLPQPCSRLDPLEPALGWPLLAAAAVGVVSMVRRWRPEPNPAEAWLLGLGAVVVLTVVLYGRRNLPSCDLYYYGRYLVPELLPALVLLGTEGVRAVVVMLDGPTLVRRRGSRMLAACAAAVLLGSQVAPYVRHPVTRLREFEGSGRIIQAIAQRVPRDAVIIAGGEGWHHGHTFNQVAGALAMRHGITVLPYRTWEAAYATSYELMVARPRATGRAAPPVFLLINEATHQYRPQPGGEPRAALDDHLAPPFEIRSVVLLEQVTDRLTPTGLQLPHRVTREGLRMALVELGVDPKAEGERRWSMDDAGLSIRGGKRPHPAVVCLEAKRDVVLELPEQGYGPRMVVLVAAPGTADQNHRIVVEIDGEERDLEMPRAQPLARDTLGPVVVEQPPRTIRMRGFQKPLRSATCPHGGLAEIRVLDVQGSPITGLTAETPVEAWTFAPDRDLGHAVEPTAWVSGRGLSRYRAGIEPTPEISGVSMVLPADAPLVFPPSPLPARGRKPLHLVITLTRSQIDPGARLVLEIDGREVARIDPPDHRDHSWQSKPIEWTPERSVARFGLRLLAADEDARVLVRDIGMFVRDDLVPGELAPNGRAR